MKYNAELYNQLYRARFNFDYRKLQAVLKTVRDSGVTLNVKLNAKKIDLLAETQRLLDLMAKERAKEQTDWGQKQRRHQRHQTKTTTNQIDHQHFLRIFQQKLGMNPDKKSLKQLFWQLAKVHHPDVGGKTADFQALQRAYEIMG